MVSEYADPPLPLLQKLELLSRRRRSKGPNYVDTNPKLYPPYKGDVKSALLGTYIYIYIQIYINT